jgi:hypothetical protein
MRGTIRFRRPDRKAIASAIGAKKEPPDEAGGCLKSALTQASASQNLMLPGPKKAELKSASKRTPSQKFG